MGHMSRIANAQDQQNETKKKFVQESSIFMLEQ